MNKANQRIAIAEACGFKVERLTKADGFEFCLVNPDGIRSVGWATESGAWSHGTPDYPNDLNAMQSAESVLTHDQWRIYLGFIMGERTIPKLASMEEFHKAWNTGAPKRSESFVRTIGKWVES